MTNSLKMRKKLLAALITMSGVAATTLLPNAAAVADVCDSCEPPTTPLPGPISARYEVTQTKTYPFYNLHGYDAEDNTGYDEAYFKINGVKVWGPRTVAAGPAPFGGPFLHAVHFTHTFYTGVKRTPSFYISMFDDDFPDADDKLGGYQVTNAPMAVGQSEFIDLTFDKDSAHYVLYIQLTRVA